MHTERSGSLTVAIVFEDARIRQLSEEEKNEIEVIYQKIQENYGSLELSYRNRLSYGETQ